MYQIQEETKQYTNAMDEARVQTIITLMDTGMLYNRTNRLETIREYAKIVGVENIDEWLHWFGEVK